VAAARLQLVLTRLVQNGYHNVVVLQAMLDVAADAGLLATSLQVISMMQMLIQARWNHENSILILPHLQPFHLARLQRP